MGFIPLNERMKRGGVTSVTPPLENTGLYYFLVFLFCAHPAFRRSAFAL